MKAKALSVKESSWTSEECRPADEQLRDPQVDGLCLPNIFKSRKVKPLSRTQSGPTYHVYYTARELLLDVLDRASVRELVRRAAGVKAGANRPSYSQSREQSSDLSEEEYAEVLTWFSIVLQSGLSAGDSCSYSSELTLTLDGWQGVLKRNSFQSSLLSLTRLDHGDKMDALSAFCSHITRRYQALYTPGQHLAVKKYQLSCCQGPCPLHLAVLCDLSSEQLQRRSRKPVVEQVVEHLLRPFCSLRLLVQLDSSAWMEGTLTDIFSGFGGNVDFVPTVKRRVTDPAVKPHPRRRTSEDLLSRLVSHLQGWTGPALLPLSDLKGSAVDDVFLLRVSGRRYTSSASTPLCSTLCRAPVQADRFSSPTRPRPQRLRPRLTTTQQQRIPREQSTSLPKHRTTCVEVTGTETSSSSSAVKLQRWNTPGVCGLDNSGNSCYLNAVLQCLCSTVPLVEHLLNQDTRQELVRCRCRVAEVFVRLLEEMWLGRSSSCAPGQLSYVTACMQCSQQTRSTQAFTVLSLPLPSDIIRCSIQDCLSLFFEQTVLTGPEQMMCSGCSLRRETAVLTCLDKPPEILMLHLKRFGCKGKNQVKLRTNVVFSMRLDLTPFVSGSLQSSSYSSYRLYAVVNHAGHLNMGHYTALCHNAVTQSWHCFDDSAVREVRDSCVQSPNAYLLLYSRRRFQTPKIHGL
ncbi:hypothetical protein INR49_010327 [Caranx melampygus]|nr:hypothetical protein INR49_010327 [Caranx melampygus]